MNNFHFKNSIPLNSPPNSYDPKLIEQLKQIELSMEEDRRKLLAEQQKQRMLQQEFYEDPVKIKTNNNKPKLAISQVEALANQVMNQISIPLNQTKPQPNRQRPNSYENAYQQPNNYPKRPVQQIPRNYNQPSRKKPDNLALENQNFRELQQKDLFVPEREISYPHRSPADQFRNEPTQPRQNNLMENIDRMEKNSRINSASKRELQKLKLQEKNANAYQYPFGSRSREDTKKQQSFARFKQQNKYPMPQNDKIGRNRDQSYQKNRSVQNNPFLKDEQYLKQKRDQQQRQYRKLLEQQVQIQKKKKQQIKKQIKQQQYQFNAYVPQFQNKKAVITQQIQNQTSFTKPRTKKIDPNGQYPQYEFKHENVVSESDLHYMKLKVDEIKLKRRKGRIDNEQYEATLKKIEEYYKCKIDRQYDEDKIEGNFIQRFAVDLQQKDNFKLNQDLADAVMKNVSKRDAVNPRQNLYERVNENLDDYQDKGNHYCENNSSRNYNMPNNSNSNQGIHPNQQPYSNPSLNTYQAMIQTTSELMMNMMKQYMEVQKDMTMNEHRLMHETLSRMYPAILMQQMHNNSVSSHSHSQNQTYGMHTMGPQYPQPNNIFNTQQVPQISPDPYSRIPSTDTKLFKEYKEKIYQVQNIYNPSMEESDFVEKSLQAIASKIPLTRNQLKISQKEEQSELENFFKKQYKIKKFKSFQFVENINQSTKQISCLSNSLSWKDGKSILNQSFERDLKLFKKLQVSRQIQFMREKINGNPSKSSPKKSLRNNSYGNQNQKLNKYQGLKVRNVLQINDFDGKTESSKNVNNSYLQSSPPQPRKNSNKDKLASNNASYSPNTRRSSNSCHQYEQYVKKQQRSSISNNPFLKKHVSSNDQECNPPVTQPKKETYNRFSSLNPPLESPKKISTQILEQDEYETQPRKRYEQIDPRDNVSIKLAEKASQSKQMMNIIVTNNQMLQKYEMSSGSKYQSVQIQSSSSPVSQGNKDSFSNVDISPVRNEQCKAYDESLETVRSEQQSARHCSGMFKKQNKCEQIEASQQATYERREQQGNNQSQFHNELKTVQSCQESSGILIMNRPKRPPMLNKNRSTSRKKQTSLVRSKVTNRTFNQEYQRHDASQQFSNNKDKYSPSYANQSEYNQYGSQNPDQSNFLRPPKIANHIQSSQELQNPKFDSNVYDSCYEETLNQKDYDKMVQKSQDTLKQEIENYGDSSNLKEVNKKQQKPGSKWKSLQQARNMARQYRQKMGQQHNRSSVQQKLSELESILSSKKDRDESVISIKRQIKNQVQSNSNIMNTVTSKKKFTDKKEILKILDDLDDEQQNTYGDDFDSYREQSASEIIN